MEEGRTALLENRGRVGQRGWSSAMYMFCGFEYWTQLKVGGIEKQQSQCTVEAKRTRESAKEESTLWRESSQARYKLCSLLVLDSTVVILELWLISDISAPCTWPTRMCNAHWYGTAQGIMCMRSPSIILYYMDPLFPILGCNNNNSFVSSCLFSLDCDAWDPLCLIWGWHLPSGCVQWTLLEVDVLLQPSAYMV